MDASLALVFALASLTDMALTDCATGCFATSDATPRISFQGAAVEFQDKIIGSEVYLGYDFRTAYGPYQLTVGASFTDTSDTWVGAGAKWTSHSINTGPLFVEASLMSGLFMQGNGPDIGGSLQFRSALGVGYEFGDGSTVAVAYDHRSNADTQTLNPGLETISIRYAIAFN